MIYFFYHSIKQSRMKLEKLFWSKAKVDILRYLIFKRQWVSMRALENELEWTFPAIKKQVDSLKEADIININKLWNSRSITMEENIKEIIKSILLYSIKSDLIKEFDEIWSHIHNYYFGNIFWNNINDIDLIVIHKDLWEEQIETIKTNISNIFQKSLIKQVYVVFMSHAEREKRYRLADRFVLSIMRQLPENQK